ncbi:hypothetical protein P9A14_02525 [Gordonia hongkongensis]|uniref:Uncharacterized protein n=1 Tax=Gordonia hongkongensis TaxID=1701090 RepID=A0AAX3T879_9ACTN|nr:hypothetical protein [Gordonia hongkongensis]QIK49648.1 hypothetical protein G8C36_22215 [Gordonia terrae]WFP25419.1 hypothetical protein P9A14_02525 [Gordonia hongkongensis]
MTAPTPPDVHRVYTEVQMPSDFGRNRLNALGFVDNAGVYHFPDGGTVLANGDYVEPEGAKLGTSVVVAEDGSRLSGAPLLDAAFPAHNEARAKHHVDARYQDAYDTDPESFAGNPAGVFAAVDGA